MQYWCPVHLKQLGRHVSQIWPFQSSQIISDHPPRPCIVMMWILLKTISELCLRLWQKVLLEVWKTNILACVCDNLSEHISSKNSCENPRPDHSHKLGGWLVMVVVHAALTTPFTTPRNQPKAKQLRPFWGRGVRGTGRAKSAVCVHLCVCCLV